MPRHLRVGDLVRLPSDPRSHPAINGTLAVVTERRGGPSGRFGKIRLESPPPGVQREFGVGGPGDCFTFRDLRLAEE
jgi:hypothetical protein